MKNPGFFVIFAILFLGLSACKNAVPEIAELRKLDGFSLDQQAITISNKSAPTVSVSGTCLAVYVDIEVSSDQGATWKSISNFATTSQFQCKATGRFNYNLSFGSTLFSSSNSATLYFRGVADLGFSEAKYLSLAALSPYFNSITSGGHQVPAIGGAYKLSGQVVGVGNGTTATGGSYKLKGRLVAR